VNSVEVVSFIDQPVRGATVQRHGFPVSGWVYVPDGAVDSVVASADGLPIGATSLFFPRADVSETLALPRGMRTSFVFDCIVPEAMRDQTSLAIEIECLTADGERRIIHEDVLSFSNIDYRTVPHGYVFHEAFRSIVPRDGVYATGPPSPDAGPEIVEMLIRYLEPGASVLDVGCGIGALGRAFRDRGFGWMGCEIRSDYIEAAAAVGLDVRLVADSRLPFGDSSFDAAFANEVLEHVRDPDVLLSEMVRVAPRAGYFSVPNFESVAVTGTRYALPWHMLEPDHWNFFSHGSLKATLSTHYRHVEVFGYGELPLLRSLDDLPIYNHLFAIGLNS